MDQFEEPKAVVEDAAIGEFVPPPRPDLTVLDGVLERNQADLLSIDGVTATWTGLNAEGADVVFVAVTDTSARPRVPQVIEGHPVEVVVVPGGFVPQVPPE